MPDFKYSAVDSNGRNVNGGVRAGSKEEALSSLAGSGIYPLQLRELGQEALIESEEKPALQLFKRVTRQDTTFFFRQLATLVGTGIPLLRSLNAIIEQCKNPKLAEILIDIRDEVQRGNALSAAMSRHPLLFSNIYISLARVAEATGKLEMILDQIASFSERDFEFRSNVKTAMAYPLFVLCFAFLSIIFILMFIMPRILIPVQNLTHALPWPTLLVINIQHFLRNYGIFLLLAVIAGFFFLRSYLRKPEGRMKFDSLKISLPVVGEFLRKVSLGQFVRSLGILAKSGVPIIESLEIVKDVVGNELIGGSVSQSIVRIKKGWTIAEALSETAQFPGTITQMISVGEESGKLGEVLLRVADSQDFELSNSIKRLNALLGPVIIIFVGIIIGFLIVAVLLPILGMSRYVI